MRVPKSRRKFQAEAEHSIHRYMRRPDERIRDASGQRGVHVHKQKYDGQNTAVPDVMGKRTDKKARALLWTCE